MDEKKICFIICSNDEKKEQEALLYINRLNIPEGFTIDCLCVHEASSLCAGYNEAMNASEAKYKVYLHQDVYITDKDLLIKVLEDFDDDRIGMIGASGVSKMSPDAVMSHGDRDYDEGKNLNPVEAVDGYFIMTQYDIPWREDLFDGWDFYEVSQCAEFHRQGYGVFVDGRLSSAMIHDTEPHSMRDYEKYRLLAIEHYSEIYGIDKNTKKVALVYFKEITFDDIAWALVQSKYDATIITSKISIDSTTVDSKDYFVRELQLNHVNAVISYDFSPALSDACMECGIKYAAWIYDSPQSALYENAVKNECNYIFSFDRFQIDRIRECGAKHVFHNLLAGNVTRMMGVSISSSDVNKYSCDVSFIGNLYMDNIYCYAEDLMDEETKKEYNTIINDIYGKWDGVDRLSGRLSHRALEALTGLEKDGFGKDFKMNLDDFFCARLIARYVAQKERIEMLDRLKEFNLKFFTNDMSISIPGVKSYPSLSHAEELPKAYALSKINLNTTLHSIKTGIPLRVFDIMAAGGFVLSNYQSEIEEFFHIGQDIDVYHDFDEMVDKVKYYLKHDYIRKQIAARGNRIVKEKYSYEKQVNNILQQIEPF